MDNSKDNKIHSLYQCYKLDSDSYRKYGDFTADSTFIIHCISGYAEIRFKGKEYKLAPSNFLLLLPHMSLETLFVSCDFQAYLIGATLGLHDNDFINIDIYFFKFLEESPFWSLSPTQKSALDGFCEMFHYVCSEINSSMRSDLLSSLHSVFFRILYDSTKTLYRSPEAKQSPGCRTLVMRFVMLLKEHFNENHSVAYYADKLCVSAKYLTYVIKATAGVTPKAVIDHVVAVESVYQLARTSLTVQEISINLGFPDQSSFGRFFKRMFVISPMAFRSNPNIDILNRLYDRVKKSSVPGLETEDLHPDGV